MKLITPSIIWRFWFFIWIRSNIFSSCSHSWSQHTCQITLLSNSHFLCWQWFCFLQHNTAFINIIQEWSSSWFRCGWRSSSTSWSSFWCGWWCTSWWRRWWKRSAHYSQRNEPSDLQTRDQWSLARIGPERKAWPLPIFRKAHPDRS